MLKPMKPIAFAAIAMSPMLLAAASIPAAAAPTINFSIVTNQFGAPTMEFKYQGGKYVWDQQAINTQFSASADTNDNNLEWAGPLHVKSLGVGGSASFTGNVPQYVKNWALQDPITFPVNFLSAYQSNFASYCDSHGGTETVVKNGLTILFSVLQIYVEATVLNIPIEAEDPTVASQFSHASRNVTMPVTVVCGPKPAKGHARPGGIASEKGGFRVTSIALNYGGTSHQTKPNPATVCKQARLTVTLKASQAGAVRFRLNKKVGNGPIEAKAIDAWAKFDGNAHFIASYQETISVDRTTRVQAMAEDLINPIGLTTQWKDVTLRCQDFGGGFAGTTENPSTPLPPRPKVPGPQDKTQGAKPTHGSFRPVIAPAKIKTAKPVIAPAKIKTAPVKTAPRPFKHIGKAASQ